MNHNNSDYQPMHIRNINENTLQNFKTMLNAESWNKVLNENEKKNENVRILSAIPPKSS